MYFQSAQIFQSFFVSGKWTKGSMSKFINQPIKTYAQSHALLYTLK